jgi:branched-chain amino acid transport system ATP-binding protein
MTKQKSETFGQVGGQGDLPILEIRHISTCYGQLEAIKDVSISINRAEIVAIIGSNGAGKTTLLMTICGMLSPRCGEIIWDGQSITGLAVEKIVKIGVSHVPERRRLFGPLTVRDNLLLGAYRRKEELGRDDFRQVFDIFPILRGKQEQLAERLSGGMQQMLAIARAMMAKPKLLLLDEPCLGLAPLVVKAVMEAVVKLQETGVTVLLAEPNVRAALNIADRAYLLERGEILLAGDADELAGNVKVRAAYLGGT